MSLVEPQATQTMLVKAGPGQTRLASDQATVQDHSAILKAQTLSIFFIPEDIQSEQHSKRTQRGSPVVSISRNVRHANSQLYVNGKDIISTGQFIQILM